MNRSNQRPDTLMQDRKPDRRNFLRRTAGPYIGSRLIFGQIEANQPAKRHNSSQGSLPS
jgi:hypothetical protein